MCIDLVFWCWVYYTPRENLLIILIFVLQLTLIPSCVRLLLLFILLLHTFKYRAIGHIVCPGFVVVVVLATRPGDVSKSLGGGVPALDKNGSRPSLQ